MSKKAKNLDPVEVVQELMDDLMELTEEVIEKWDTYTSEGTKKAGKEARVGVTKVKKKALEIRRAYKEIPEFQKKQKTTNKKKKRKE